MRQCSNPQFMIIDGKKVDAWVNDRDAYQNNPARISEQTLLVPRYHLIDDVHSAQVSSLASLLAHFSSIAELKEILPSPMSSLP